MSTIISNVFSINGVVDTNRSVLENMNEIATSAGAWVTFDSGQGKWAVVINQTGSSVKSFNDSNIIGSINISSTGLTEMYNGVEVEFPHKDLNDEPDYIKFSVAAGARYPNEPDNVLSMNLTLVNNPIQAQLLAARELKQSRVDKVIEFRTDFSSLGLQAGQLISITNTAYGYTSKVFRIIKIQEDDEQDGVFTLSITALEYDADVYSTAGLLREERNRNTGIDNKSINTAVQNRDNSASSSATANGLLSGGANTTTLWSMMGGLGQQGVPSYDSFVTTMGDAATVKSVYDSWVSSGYPDQLSSVTHYVSTFGITYSASAIPQGVEVSGESVSFHVSMPQGNVTYSATTIVSYWPSVVYLRYNAVDDIATSTVVEFQTTHWNTPNVNFYLDTPPYGYYWIMICPRSTNGLGSAANTFPSSYATPFIRDVGGPIAIAAYVFSVYGPS